MNNMGIPTAADPDGGDGWGGVHAGGSGAGS